MEYSSPTRYADIRRACLNVYLRDGMRCRLFVRRASQSMSALVCGLDVHKESTYATILDQDGEIITQKRMPKEEVPDFLRPHGVEKVAMEASTSIARMQEGW